MGKTVGEAEAAAEEGESGLEVELTLGGDPAALDRGWRAAVPTGDGGTERRLRSTYYDTGDFRLRRRGFTLRVRDDGERLVQTLKSDGPSGGGAVLRRNEWSRPVETPEPTLPVAPDKAIRDAAGPVRASELAPAFSTDVMRRTAVVEVAAPDRGKALVELALDSGEIRARNRRATVSELEARARRGAGERAFPACHDDAGFCLAPHPDGEQGQARICPRRVGRATPATRRRLFRSPTASPWTNPRQDLSCLRRSVCGESRCGARSQRSRRRAPVSRRFAPDAFRPLGLQERSLPRRCRLAGPRG